MAYHEVQTQLDAATVRGRRYDSKSSFMRSISDDAIDALIDRFANLPSPLFVTVTPWTPPHRYKHK
jgi:hypothetical protein